MIREFESNIGQGPESKTDQPRIDNVEEDIILSQDEGLSLLYQFLTGGASFSQLRPFILDISNEKPSLEGKTSSRYYFHLGLSEKRTLGLWIGIPHEIEQKNKSGILLIVPHKDEDKGLKPYYWLDFYQGSLVGSEQNISPFTSCRLKPEEPINKIDFIKWHNLGEQLLADFLGGENGIGFNDLIPFTISIEQKSSLSAYTIACIRGLELRLRANPLIDDNIQLKFIPQQDNQGFYQWIDVLKVISKVPEEQWPKVTSYRLLQERRPFNAHWFGPERQLLLDYLLGNSRVRFEDLRSIRIQCTAKKGAIHLVTSHIDERYVKLYPPHGFLELGEEAIVIPEQDEQKLYQWLSLYRVDHNSGEPHGDPLASARIIDEKTNQQNWLGVERQLLKDYCNGIVNFNNLRSISLTIGKSDTRLILWLENHRQIDLLFSKSFNLRQGDKLALVPEKEVEAGATFLLVRDDIPTARYKLVLPQKRFVRIDNEITENLIDAQTYLDQLNRYIEALKAGENITFEEFLRQSH